MYSIRRNLPVLCAAAALLAAPTATAASAPAPATALPSNGWLTLSMLTSSGSAALDGSAVAAAEPENEAPPQLQSGGIGMPPVPVMAIWLAVLATDIYIATRHHHHFHPVPNSPD